MAREKGGFWVAFCAAFFYPATSLIGRRRVSGVENVPTGGPALLVGNHVSHIDPLYTAILVHRAGRVPRFMGKASLWRVPVLRSVLRGTRQIPVYRGGPQAGDSLRDAERALREGGIVLIYPEGTITRDPDGWPMRPRTGVARLALAVADLDIPVVPVVHWGTQQVYDHYRRRFRPLPRRDVVTCAGPPIDPASLRAAAAAGDADRLRAVTDLIMGRVRDLLGEVRGETPPGHYYERAEGSR